MNDSSELPTWLKLWLTPGIGPKTFQQLLQQFNSPADILSADRDTLHQAGLKPALINALKASENGNDALIHADLDWLEASSAHHILTLHDSRYPELLRQIADPPPLLYAHGDPLLLNDPQIAIVGSRNPTRGGSANADDFSRYLAKSGFVISSGLALGVDGIAHLGALESGVPTIAVIATGIDRVYPSKHRELAHRIVEQGVIVSEFPLGTQPRAENFPRRNRIISGLSYGTLVVEAALRSGSLITARCASEQGREVFAIPGSIHNPLARGCHQLIRQGAKLVESAQDIFEEMTALVTIPPREIQDASSADKGATNRLSVAASSGAINPNDGENQAQTQSGLLDADQRDLLEKMGFDPIGVDELVNLTNKPAEQVSASLLMLELHDYVSAEGAGMYLRLK